MSPFFSGCAALFEVYGEDGLKQLDINSYPLCLIGTYTLPGNGSLVTGPVTGLGVLVSFSAPDGVWFRPSYTRVGAGGALQMRAISTADVTAYVFARTPNTLMTGAVFQIFDANGVLIFDGSRPPLNVIDYARYTGPPGAQIISKNHSAAQSLNWSIAPVQAPEWGMYGAYMGNWDGRDWYEYYSASCAWRKNGSSVELAVTSVFEEAEHNLPEGGSNNHQYMLVKIPAY
ncbi:MAG: hypothetical protein QM645_11315 [Asticcacaulis sp.]